MHLKRVIISLLVVCASPTAGQNMERVRHNIATLCSPSMAGRGYSGKGDKKAAQWIAETFRAIGVKPVGKSYFQPFPIDVNTFPSKMKLVVDGKKLQPGRDFIPSPVSARGKGYLKTIFLSDLARCTDSLIDRLKQINYKKKAILFNLPDYYQLLETCPELVHQLNQAALWIGITDPLTAQIGEQALSPPFLWVTKEVIDSSAQRIRFCVKNQLKKNYITQNVIGYIKGTIAPEKFIVFAAHYDHLGTIGKGIYIPGANDNAAGVAMLIELAHYFSEHPPALSVCFMAFSAEELGLLGSTYYVQHPLFPLASIRFVWNLDLVGTGKEGATIVNGTLHPKEFQRLQRFNDSLQALPKLVPRSPAANSDHYPFSTRGVPSFFVYLMDSSYPYYHHIEDKADKLPLTGFEGLFRLLVAFTAQGVR